VIRKRSFDTLTRHLWKTTFIKAGDWIRIDSVSVEQCMRTKKCLRAVVHDNEREAAINGVQSNGVQTTASLQQVSSPWCQPPQCCNSCGVSTELLYRFPPKTMRDYPAPSTSSSFDLLVDEDFGCSSEAVAARLWGTFRAVTIGYSGDGRQAAITEPRFVVTILTLGRELMAV
jgi:hypothetical protein